MIKSLAVLTAVSLTLSDFFSTIFPVMLT